MADRPQESEGHPVIAGLLALLGVGLAVGLLVSGAALAGTSVLGLGESDGGGQASSDQTINVPKPEPTEEQTGALITLEPKPSSEGDEESEAGTRARGRDLAVRGRHRGPARRADRPVRRLPRRRGRHARRPAPRGRRVGRLRRRRRDRDGQQRDVLHLRDHRAHRAPTPGGSGTPRPTRSPTRCESRSAERQAARSGKNASVHYTEYDTRLGAYAVIVDTVDGRDRVLLSRCGTRPTPPLWTLPRRGRRARREPRGGRGAREGAWRRGTTWSSAGSSASTRSSYLPSVARRWHGPVAEENVRVVYEAPGRGRGAGPRGRRHHR